LYNSSVTIEETSFSQAVAQSSTSLSAFTHFPATAVRVSCQNAGHIHL
jgi:hypothetical protein